MTTTTVPAQLDAVGLLNALTHEQLVERLGQIEAEEKALRVLLRAVNRRERSRRSTGSKPSPEAKAVPG